MASSSSLQTRMANLFVQPDGCGGSMALVPCVVVADIDISFGDTETTYCFDEKGNYVPRSIIRSTPDETEFEVMTDNSVGANWLDTLARTPSCPFPLYIAFHCQKQGKYGGWDLLYRISGANITGIGVTSPVQREDADIDRKFTLKASPSNIDIIFRPSIAEVATDTTNDLGDITFCYNEDICPSGDCGDLGNIKACETGWVAVKTPTALATAKVLTPETGNCNSYEASTLAPFPADEIIVATHCSTASGDSRIFFANGTSATLEISYSDGDKEVYTAATINGGVANSIPSSPNAFAEKPDGTLFICTDLGYILRSQDNGLTWEDVETGVATTEDLKAIAFRDNQFGIAVGDNGAVISTSNGGESWGAVTMPVALSTLDFVAVEAGGSAWYIASSGSTTSDGIWFSKYGGGLVTWTQANFSTSGVTITDLKVIGCSMFVAYNKAADVTTVGKVRYSANGRDFEAEQTILNTGFNALYMANEQVAWVVGDGGKMAKLSGLLR